MKLKQFCSSSGRELYVIILFAVIPSLFIDILALLELDTDFSISLIKLFAFIRITHDEDKKTLTSGTRHLLVRLLTAVLALYIVSFSIQWLTIHGSPFLEAGDIPKSSQYPRTRKWIFYEKYSVIATEVTLEYLRFASAIANYRMVFLGIVLIVNILLKMFAWCFTGRDSEE